MNSSGKSNLNLSDASTTTPAPNAPKAPAQTPSQPAPQAPVGKSSLTLTDNLQTTQPQQPNKTPTSNTSSDDSDYYSDLNDNVVYYDKSKPKPNRRFKEQILIGYTINNNIIKTDDKRLYAFVNDDWKEYPLSDEAQAIKDANLSIAKEESVNQVQVKAWLETIRADSDLLSEFMSMSKLPANVTSFSESYKYYNKAQEYSKAFLLKRGFSLKESDMYKHFYRKMYAAKLGTVWRRLGHTYPPVSNIALAGGGEELLKFIPIIAPTVLDIVATGAAYVGLSQVVDYFDERTGKAPPPTPNFADNEGGRILRERWIDGVVDGQVQMLNGLTLGEFIQQGGILDVPTMRALENRLQTTKTGELRKKSGSQRRFNKIWKDAKFNQLSRNDYIEKQKRIAQTIIDADNDINRLRAMDLDEPIEVPPKPEEKIVEEKKYDAAGNYVPPDAPYKEPSFPSQGSGSDIKLEDVDMDKLYNEATSPLEEDENINRGFNYFTENPETDVKQLMDSYIEDSRVFLTGRIQNLKSYLHDVREQYIEDTLRKIKTNLNQVTISRFRTYMRNRFNRRVEEIEMQRMDEDFPEPPPEEEKIPDSGSDVGSDIGELEPILRIGGLGRRQVLATVGADRSRRTIVRKLVKFLVAAGVAVSVIKNLLDALKFGDTPEPFPPLPPYNPDGPNKPVGPDGPIPVGPTGPTGPTPAGPTGPIPGVIGNAGEGVERMYAIDPSEAELFIMSQKQAEEDDRRWNEYSHVASGNGLGNVKTNPLLRLEALNNMRRFRNTIKRVPSSVSPLEVGLATKGLQLDIQGLPKSNKDVQFIPIYQNTYGKEDFEDEFYDPYIQGQKVIFTNPYANTSDKIHDRAIGILTRNIENPDIALYQQGGFNPKYKPVKEGEVTRPAFYFGLNKNVRDDVPDVKYNYYNIRNNKEEAASLFQFGDTFNEEYGDTIMKKKKSLYANISKFHNVKKS